MIYCSACGNPIPEDSRFCPFCGAKVSEAAEKRKEEAEPKEKELPTEQKCPAPAESRAEPSPGGQAPAGTNQENKAPEPPAVLAASVEAHEPFEKNKRKWPLPPKGKTPGKAVWMGLCGALLLCTVGSLVYAFSAQAKCSSLQAEISSLSQQNQELKAQNEDSSDLKRQNQNLRDSLLDYKPRAEYFDALVGYAEEYAVGYSSKNFHASDGLLVMGKDDARVSVTITGTYAATYYMEVLGASTSCEWGETYGGTMTAYIDPVLAGVSAVKFTNSVNSQSFIILCIVE